MPTGDLLAILQSLRSAGFRDLSDARLSATVPIAERLINDIVATTLPTSLPVREVHVHPEAGDAFAVRLSPRSGLLPSLTVKLTIHRQPSMPHDPVLVLRLGTLGGLIGIAASALPIAPMLPPGVRLEGEFVHVDLAAIAAQQGFADVLDFVRTLRITTEPGRAILHLDAAV